MAESLAQLLRAVGAGHYLDDTEIAHIVHRPRRRERQEEGERGKGDREEGAVDEKAMRMAEERKREAEAEAEADADAEVEAPAFREHDRSMQGSERLFRALQRELTAIHVGTQQEVQAISAEMARLQATCVNAVRAGVFPAALPTLSKVALDDDVLGAMRRLVNQADNRHCADAEDSMAQEDMLLADRDKEFVQSKLRDRAVALYHHAGVLESAAARRLRLLEQCMHTHCAMLQAATGNREVPAARAAHMLNTLAQHTYFVASDVQELLSRIEVLYARAFSFCNSNVGRAELIMAAQRGYSAEASLASGVDGAPVAATSAGKGTFVPNRSVVSIFGMRLGITIVLAAWAFWDGFVDDPLGQDVWHDPALKVFRGLGNLLLLLWLWGVSTWVWSRAGIDWRPLLDLPPDVAPNGATPLMNASWRTWKEAFDLTIAFLVCFICFYKVLRGVFLASVPASWAHVFPVLLLLIFTFKAVFPWSERKPFWCMLWRVIAAPYYAVNFRDGYIGDILTSLVRVLIDLVFSYAFFFAGVHGWLNASVHFRHDPIEDNFVFQRVVIPLLTALPLLERFLQNVRRSRDTGELWPHWGNAMKYMTAMTVVLFGVFQPSVRSSPLWIFCFVVATAYQFLWDVFMDWDILRWESPNQRHHHGGNGAGVTLRHPRLFGDAWVYVLVIALNFCLRFLWTLTLVPEESGDQMTADLQIRMSPFIAAAEICRRTMWGFLRLENEQISVYGTAEADNLAVLHARGAEALERMEVGQSTNKTAGAAASLSSSAARNTPAPAPEESGVELLGAGNGALPSSNASAGSDAAAGSVPVAELVSLK